MRRAGLSFVALLAAAPFVTAQLPPGADPAARTRVPIPGGGTPVGTQPGGVPTAPAVGFPGAAPAAVDPILMGHLKQWEKVMQGTTNFYTECTLTRQHLVKKKTTEHTGKITCLKPNMAWMRIEEKPAAGQKPDPDNYLAYICTGQAVYEYDGPAKQVTEFALPNGGVGDNLLLTFMAGGLTANGIVQRFDMKLLKEDQHYVYLEILPRDIRDKTEFESMKLVLFGKNVPMLAYLPCKVVIRKGNGQEEEVWDFPQPQVNVPGVKPANFVFVKPPADWKVQKAQVQAQPPGQPRVARPQGSP